ncbi:MAG: integration host factor subunit alpha [Pseudomonadota bacterium]
MTGKTMTRADLTDAVYRSLGVSRNESAHFVERILEEISAALERGDNVKISSFGTFSVRDKKLRMGRNPKTGEEVPITPRRVITFRASHVLKDHINDALKTEKAAAAE